MTLETSSFYIRKLKKAFFQVVPPEDSQVVRGPAIGLDHIPKDAIGTQTKTPMVQ